MPGQPAGVDWASRNLAHGGGKGTRAHRTRRECAQQSGLQAGRALMKPGGAGRDGRPLKAGACLPTDVCQRMQMRGPQIKRPNKGAPRIRRCPPTYGCAD